MAVRGVTLYAATSPLHSSRHVLHKSRVTTAQCRQGDSALVTDLNPALGPNSIVPFPWPISLRSWYTIDPQ